MQKVELIIRNSENIGNLSEEQLLRINEIMNALVSSGGLTGVRGGKTILHFDGNGVFQGVELDYWPWRRRA
jgi:hypothetical protein